MFAASFFYVAAAVKDLPVRIVNGHSYHYYEVQPKETVYSLCHRLDISKEELIRNNPAVADGLKSGMLLFFPVEEGETLTPANASANGVMMITHNVEKGQTIYGIATKYGISTDELIAQNPVVREGLKAGQQLHLTIPVANNARSSSALSSTQDNAVSNEVSSEPTGYIVKKKETFYSISRAHNLTVAQLEAANPGITTLKEGQVLSIPTADSTGGAESTSATNLSDSIKVSSPEKASHGSLAAVDSIPVSEQRLSIAVMLPFMLGEETPSKSAQRYTEFYKGFLMAVDSLRNNGTPIHINAYDTEGSTDKVRELLANTELKGNSLIIAPDNAEQLHLLGDFGRENNIKVLNTFIVRDEAYLTNPAIMQGNIPSQLMLDKAADAIAERVSYSVPVFINLAGGANDKTDFTDALKKRLDAKGIAYKTVNIEGKLTAADLKSLPSDESYSFIPTSARQSDLNKLLPGIIEWRDEAVMPAVKVIGYPEWTTFRGETLTNMHNLNTIVYSRFFTDDDNIRTRRVEDRYRSWYGSRMENAVPRQGLLGFDTGMFVIGYLKNSGTRYDGAQNGYSFPVPEDAEGLCNNVLYLINYRPGGLIEKINL